MNESNQTSTSRGAPPAFYRAMFTAEVAQATTELRRPAGALFASGAVAGGSIGIVILLLGAVLAQQGAEGTAFQLYVGAIYAVGFTLAILARTDLFTEYTTISVLPLLTGDATFGSVVRLWVLVYLGNLFGGLVAVLLGIAVGPGLGLLPPGEMASFARHLSDHSWWVIVLSGAAAGWLMGMLSWLIAGGRDTTSQIVFIWIVGITIGFLGLHHAITGGVEMLIAALESPRLGARDVLHVLVWTTAGNSIGGILFAVIIQQAVRLGNTQVNCGERNDGHERPTSRRDSKR